MSSDELEYRFRLSDREFALAWVTEYYRRPGLRSLRVAMGPALFVLGTMLGRGADPLSRVMGYVAMAYGIFHAVRPLLSAWWLAKQRRRSGRSDVEITLTVGPRGLAVDDGKARREIAWREVTAAGLARQYVWIEVRGSSRATIPRRVIDDLPRLEAELRRRTTWVG